MISIALHGSIAAVSLAMMMNMYRLVVGPDAPDRILAVDTLVINSIALVLLFGILFNSTLFFEASLLLAMVGFLTTVAYCKYLLRGNVIE